jgi:hypothetical protein
VKRSELVLQAVAGRRMSASGWVRANCPVCEIRTGKPDKKQCLGVFIPTGKWHCFRCGSGGRVDVPEDWDRPEPSALVEQERAAMEPPESFTLLFEEPGWSSRELNRPRRYLRKRGIDDDLGHDARIGYCDEGKFRGRVVVPITAPDSDAWFGWSARAIFDGALRKYIYPEGMRRADLLYNHAALLEEGRDDEPVFIVEGVFDALAFWPDGVAVLGKPSPFQLEALIASRRPIVVALDGDAWIEGLSLAMRLRFEGQRSGNVRLPPGKDPDEMVEWVREQAPIVLAQDLP